MFGHQKWAGEQALSVAAFTTVLALGMSVVSAPADEIVKIATEGTYPPWTFANPQGGVQGFEVDVANEACRRLPVKCEFIIQDFQGFIPGLNAGKFDVVISAMSITEERKKAVDFSRPYVRLSTAFAVPKGSPLAQMPGTGELYNLDTQGEEAQKAIDAIKPLLGDKTLGIQAGSISARFVDRYLKDDVGSISEYKSTQNQDIDLSSGRTDVSLGTTVAITKSLSTPPLSEFTIAGPSFTGGVLGVGYGAAFRKSDGALREKFDKALGEIVADGTIKRLSDKWIGTDVTPK